MHRFAWDRVSFQVPDDWELSSFETMPGKSQVEMDDGGAKRLVAQWLRLRAPVNAPRLHARFAKAAQALKKKARISSEIANLPANWSATQFSMPAGDTLLTAAHLAERALMFFSFTLYFYGKAKPADAAQDDVLRQLTQSLTIHTGPIVPWECYDMSFRLSADFRLAETAFLSGRKQMVFEWRSRRLYVWLISLADMALSGRSVNVWACDFLHQIEGLRGPRFTPGPKDEIAYSRRAIWPLGHADQLRRLCFRYKIGFQHMLERNQIFLWAYHYRREGDLKKLEGLAFGRND